MNRPNLYTVTNVYCSSIFVPHRKPVVTYEIRVTPRRKGPPYVIQNGTFKEVPGCSIALSHFTLNEELGNPQVYTHQAKTNKFPAIRSTGVYFIDYSHPACNGMEMQNFVLTKPVEDKDKNVVIEAQIIKLTTLQFDATNPAETVAIGTLVLFGGENNPIVLEWEMDEEHHDVLLLTTINTRFGLVTSMGEFYTVKVLPDENYQFRQDLQLIRQGITRKEQMQSK